MAMEETEYAFPMDAEEYEDGYDREYIADDFARYFRAFITSGIIADGGNIAESLQVVANDDMTTTLKAGNLIINGYRYELTKDMIFQHRAADGVLDRIDRISITMDTAEREIHAILREGKYSFNPVAEQCRRTSEYMDYVVADVRIVKGAIKITQANITDTRLSTELCGIAFPFWKLDTGPFFAQLNAFYQEFVDKSNASYAEFKKMALEAYQEFYSSMTDYFADLSEAGQEKYNDFSAGIQSYITALKEKGDTDLAEITQQLIDFRNKKEADFLEWFEMIKGVFSTDAAGELLLKIEELTEQVELNQVMITTGKVLTMIATSQGDYIVDSMGNPILIGWPICKCNS